MITSQRRNSMLKIKHAVFDYTDGIIYPYPDISDSPSQKEAQDSVHMIVRVP